MGMKTNKSYSKRIKVTKNGKLVVRAKGHNHFNARATGRDTLAKRRTDTVEMKNKARGRYLPFA